MNSVEYLSKLWRKKISPAATYSLTLAGNTIGTEELDFRVRDGNGYCLFVMTTEHLIYNIIGSFVKGY